MECLIVVADKYETFGMNGGWGCLVGPLEGFLGFIHKRRIGARRHSLGTSVAAYLRADAVFREQRRCH